MNQLFLFFLFSISALNGISQSKINTPYKNKIDSLNIEDQRVRNNKHTRAAQYLQKIKTGTKKHVNKNRLLKSIKLTDEWKKIDSSNIHCLLQLIAAHGFPSVENIGSKSHFNAFLIMLHFDTDSNNKILQPILDTALSKRHISPWQYASIIDRHLAYFNQDELFYTHNFCAFLDLSERKKHEVLENRHAIGLNKFSFKCSSLGRLIVIE